MARPLRIEFPGAVTHVTARGNNRESIFTEDGDRERFLELLGREVEQQRWRCHAYCLMENHYHLLLETPEASLGRGMARLNRAYSQWFNRRHGLPHVFDIDPVLIGSVPRYRLEDVLAWIDAREPERRGERAA